MKQMRSKSNCNGRFLDWIAPCLDRFNPTALPWLLFARGCAGRPFQVPPIVIQWIMGSGASIDAPEEVDLEAFKTLSGDRFSQEAFEESKHPPVHSPCSVLTVPPTDKNSRGTITKDKLVQLNSLTDCFLTHDWGVDELERSNHERVARVNTSLKERGFVTWFDSDRLVGNIVAQMCNAIDRTKCVIVFITKNYMEKVSGDNANDNCQLEFNYALRQKSAKHMIAVVMESRMRDTSTWRGAVGEPHSPSPSLPSPLLMLTLITLQQAWHWEDRSMWTSPPTAIGTHSAMSWRGTSC